MLNQCNRNQEFVYSLLEEEEEEKMARESVE